MRIVLTIAIMFVLSSCQAQGNEFNCDSFLSSKIVFTDTIDTKALLKKFQKLQKCGIKEDDAKYLLSGPMLGTVMVELVNAKGSGITFGDFLTALTEYSKTEYYQQIKKKLDSQEQ